MTITELYKEHTCTHYPEWKDVNILPYLPIIF